MATIASWARQALEWRWTWVETTFTRELTAYDEVLILNDARDGWFRSEILGRMNKLLRERHECPMTAGWVAVALRYGLRTTDDTICEIGGIST